MTNSSFFLVTILNLEILFNFSVQALRFTQTNQKKKKKKKKKKNGLQHKIHFTGRTLNLCFKFRFLEISLKSEKSLKLQLN